MEAAVREDADDSVTDGRTKRSLRTRAAVVDAVMALVKEGDLRPTAPRIAERAGVSLRSVFQHFNDLGALHAAVAERQIAEVAGLTRPIDPHLPLAERVPAFVAQRAAVLEAVTPIRRASLVNPLSPEGHSGYERMRSLSREEVARVFATELDRLSGEERAEVLEAIDMVSSWQAWEGLRQYQRLDDDTAKTVVGRILMSLLTNRSPA
ncbi:MAG: TetR/AcrR family transcriptional regulator [Acidimicrobiia bacterium]